MRGWRDRLKEKKINPREPMTLLEERLRKLHPDESQRSLQAIIERIRELDQNIRGGR